MGARHSKVCRAVEQDGLIVSRTEETQITCKASLLEILAERYRYMRKLAGNPKTVK